MVVVVVVVVAYKPMVSVCIDSISTASGEVKISIAS